MTRDVEYMVDSENEIQLIDQFTGRVLSREYSDGLQQAIQAKEGVRCTRNCHNGYYYISKLL